MLNPEAVTEDENLNALLPLSRHQLDPFAPSRSQEFNT